MFLSKKNIPAAFVGMWWAGVMNIITSMMNLATFVFITQSWLSLFCSIVSLVVAVVIFVAIRRMTAKMLWDKLQMGSRQTFSGEDQQAA